MRRGHQGVDAPGIGVEWEGDAGADDEAPGPRAGANLASYLGPDSVGRGADAIFDGVDVAEDDPSLSGQPDDVLDVDAEPFLAFFDRDGRHV